MSDDEALVAPSALRDLLGKLGWLPDVRLGALWTAAAGDVLSRNTRVAGTAPDALRIECSSEGWLYEVQTLEPDLLARLHQLGLDWVRHLELTARAQPPEPPRRPEPQPLADGKVQQIRSVLRDVESPAVRQALEKLLVVRARAGAAEVEGGHES